MWSFLKHIFQLTLSPVHGWEDISAARSDVNRLLASGFYPLTALTSVSVFIALFYHEGLTLSALLSDAIITFVMFFLGYFFSSFILSVYLPKLSEGGYTEKRANTFIIYSLALLEIISIIQNCVPITLAITLFLPIYVGIIMWKGACYMNIPENNVGSFMLISIFGVLMPPYVLMFLFKLIMPS